MSTDPSPGSRFSRWRLPSAAMALHLCIGQAYALSAFYQPVLRSGDAWIDAHLGRVFTLAMLMLGLTAALEHRLKAKWGARAVACLAAVLFCGGLALAGIAIQTQQIYLLYSGYGLVAGCGMGLGYVAPMQMLMDWFPERRALTTGLAVTGFGGGAMLATALSSTFLGTFGASASHGAGETFIALAAIYGVIMLAACAAMRMPGQAPAVSAPSLEPRGAVRTPQFYLLWFLLLISVYSGISLFPSAPAVLSEAMGRAASVTEISGFIALLSLSNMAGRFLVAAGADHLGRRNSMTLLLLAGVVFYAAMPAIAAHLNLPFTVLGFMTMIAIYGGIFAVMPAYVADVFGPRFAGAIHGRLLTAWSAGAVLSFAAAEWMSRMGQQAGRRAEMFHGTALLFLVGLLLNTCIRPAVAQASSDAKPDAEGGAAVGLTWPLPPSLMGSWLVVLIPLLAAIAWTVRRTEALPLAGQLGVTLLPLITGAALSAGFHVLDRSRFAVRGVAGPYFTALALLFGLYASLMANDVWQRISKANELLDDQVITLHSMVTIGHSIAPGDTRIQGAVEVYARTLAATDCLPTPPRSVPPALAEPLNRLQQIGADADFFQGHAPQQNTFVAAVEHLRVSNLTRINLRSAPLDSAKLASLLIFGLLTQIAIGFCHAGNARAISTTVMLFSVGFSAAVGIMALMDGSGRLADAAEIVAFLGLR